MVSSRPCESRFDSSAFVMSAEGGSRLSGDRTDRLLRGICATAGSHLLDGCADKCTRVGRAIEGARFSDDHFDRCPRFRCATSLSCLFASCSDRSACVCYARDGSPLSDVRINRFLRGCITTLESLLSDGRFDRLLISTNPQRNRRIVSFRWPSRQVSDIYESAAQQKDRVFPVA